MAFSLTFFRKICNSLLKVLYPPRCLVCQKPVLETGTFCASCFHAISWITGPKCSICGRPMEFDLEDERTCLGCQKKKRPYVRARALFRYTAASKPLILRFKHADGMDVLPPLVSKIKKEHADMIRQADYLIPIPLHYTRLVARRYNQSLLLARALSPQKTRPDFLIRHKRTKSQGHFNRAQRQKNVAGVFSVPERFKPLLEGKRILLIDDVITTGATVSEAAKVLLKAGVKSVEVFALGMV